jgi:hypothetical protein
MSNYYDKLRQKAITAAGAEEPTGTDFFISVVDDKVLLLTRIDHEAGTIEYRADDSWIPVSDTKDIPEFENDFKEVSGTATEIWDAAEGEDLTLADFEETITE